MHSRVMSTTQATHRTRTTALRMCAYIAPLVAQCIMLIALLVRQQWLFALMIGSGCCATAATMVLMLLQSRPTPSESSGDSPHSTAYASGAIGENPVRACTGTTLEHLHGMADDAAPFRTICHSWTRTACSPPTTWMQRAHRHRPPWPTAVHRLGTPWAPCDCGRHHRVREIGAAAGLVPRPCRHLSPAIPAIRAPRFQRRVGDGTPMRTPSCARVRQ